MLAPPAFNSSCRAGSRAGGNRRSARISGLWVLPPRRLPPSGRWCGDPVPRPLPWPLPSGPGPAASMAYHLSRSRGVGAKIILRRRSLTPICHCSKDWSISLAPIITPHETQRSSNPITSPIYPIPLRISPWLWFSLFHYLTSHYHDSAKYRPVPPTWRWSRGPLSLLVRTI